MMVFLQLLIHYGLHFLAPGLLSRIFFKDIWKLSWTLMVTTMLVDLDHLLATPIFESSRCSIGFHPLHSYYAIGFYVLLLLIPNRYVRIIAVGLLLHMFADFQNCLWIISAT
jgi:hypothetical protein